MWDLFPTKTGIHSHKKSGIHSQLEVNYQVVTVDALQETF